MPNVGVERAGAGAAAIGGCSAYAATFTFDSFSRSIASASISFFSRLLR